MSYTHTSIPVELTEQAFCADCGNPLPAGALARRRVTDTGAPEFKIEWLCAGECGPIIDVSDDTLMRKRIAELEQALQDTRDLLCAPFDHATDRLLAINDRIAQTMPYVPGGCREIEDDKARIKELEAELKEVQQERDEIDAELAAERATHRQTAANLNAQLLPARGPRAHIVTDKDQ